VVWALLMPGVGFFVISLLAFLVLIAIASFEPLTPRLIGLYAVSAVVIVGAFHLLMTLVLNLRMPDGLLF
jgi:putative tricarboxylic transport membrane protein